MTWKPARTGAIWIGVAFTAYNAIAPFVPAPAGSAVAVVFSTFCYLAGAAALMAAISGAGYHVRTHMATLLTGALIALLISLWPVNRWDQRLWPLVFAIQNTAVAFAAASLGVWVSHILREPSILAPAALFAAIADVVIVRVWLTRYMQMTGSLFSAVSQKVPMAGSASPAAPPGGLHHVGYIGPADLVFMALFLAAAWRFEMRPVQTTIWLTVILTLTMLAQALLGDLRVPVIGTLMYIPALVPIAVVFLAVNARYLRLTSAEWRAVGIASLIVALLAYGVIRIAG